MRAWLLDSLNGIENLRLAETEPPSCARGEVLLRVRFAALNPADAFLAQAQYPAKPALPHVLGRDGVGEVAAVGDGVANPRVGETVGILRCDAGVERWGTLAEQVAVPAASVTPVPEGWRLEEMAAAPLTFLTAWQALTQWSDPPAPPPAGSSLLVTGASGGVGVASVLLGRSMGLRVAALSRSAEKGARLSQLGADFVFDPADPDLRKKVAAALAPAKIDLAVDNVGGPFFNQIVAMLGEPRPDQRGGPQRRHGPRVQHGNSVLPPQPHRRRIGRLLFPARSASRMAGDRHPPALPRSPPGNRPYFRL